MQNSTGALFVIATPIGNLEDLGPRAARTLREVDCVLAEDTRITRRLLDACAISTPMQSLHDHNERRVSESLVARMKGGERMALVSDAGTPLLSDPGYSLVRAAQDGGVSVQVVPGPSAVTAALSVAGLPAQPFWFEGFLPPRPAARRQRLKALAPVQATLVFYEAPHRVVECLSDLVDVLGGEREAAIARELSKRFEEVRRDTLADLLAHVRTSVPRGEFVLLVAGCREEVGPDQARLAEVLECLLELLPAGQAASAAARITGARRKDAYALALQLKRDEG